MRDRKMHESLLSCLKSSTKCFPTMPPLPFRSPRPPPRPSGSLTASLRLSPSTAPAAIAPLRDPPLPEGGTTRPHGGRRATNVLGCGCHAELRAGGPWDPGREEARAGAEARWIRSLPVPVPIPFLGPSPCRPHLHTVAAPQFAVPASRVTALVLPLRETVTLGNRICFAMWPHRPLPLFVALLSSPVFC
ncbi:hypothetical protein BS78_06G252500 [Paspalum vaginatum]|nr:hypothetical protein BS78_06G252500 [Paspalum vaginatum]